MAQIIINSLDNSRIRERIVQLRRSGAPVPPEVSALLKELEKAELMEPEQIPPGVVTMHSKVLLRYLDSDRTMELELVYPEEADVKQKKISIFSPIATALIGFREGDQVEWQIPSGLAKLKIEKVLHQPEAAGAYDL